MSRIHYCTGAITRLEAGFRDEIPLVDLLESGFDEMDLISLDTTLETEIIEIEVKSRRDYSDIRRLTKHSYDTEKLVHRAMIAFQSDYKNIATLVNAFKFKIRINGKLSNIMSFVSYARGRLVRNGYFKYSISERQICIADLTGMITLPLVSCKGVKATRNEGEVRVAILSERGLSSLVKNLDNLSIHITKKEIQQLRDELKVTSDIEKPKPIQRLINIADNKSHITFPYSPDIVDLIKNKVPSCQRNFDKNTKAWVIDMDLFTESFINDLSKTHNFTIKRE
ncbi:hypothetical protein LMH73_021265 [Vibrio splendidus]